MGWWDTEDGLELGDGPLDLAEEFLSQLAQEYIEDRDRKPKLKEILRTIELVLEQGAEEYFEEGEHVLLSGLSVKTKPRPKKQKFQIGDIFTVPLDDHLALGYLTPQNGLAEFFHIKSKKVPSMDRLRGVERTRPPFLIDLSPLEKWKWKVIGNLPFDLEGFVPQQFIIGGQVTCGTDTDRGFLLVSSQLRLATDSEREVFPKMRLVNEAYLVQYLDKLLKDVEPV